MINSGETVRLFARPVDWEGEVDDNATVTYTVINGGVSTDPYTMNWVASAQAFRAEHLFPAKGVYEIRFKAVLEDNSVAKHTRRIEVRS